ncbi:probable pre-mRNA-splicing factor ATP-dependent RNA helicase DEAH9 [Gastrolobium bilobum]|uniref:probable pre-mRNA-splicing factor ATP-dependent RNA helicase DEAH9 n=1 Tax=Gastrolobium bilobum TaxID=150636 RepID=UPI002AAFCAD4|nr:probable pre-mRNA-splicing factor ATP-dependent RNA helicase DEAH9 [Gastrolobium bilobum]
MVIVFQKQKGRGRGVSFYKVGGRIIYSTCSMNHDEVFVAELKALGIDNILGFDWPASPSPEAMIRALEVLYSLGVLDDDVKLTSPTGFQVAEIPLVYFGYH